MITLEQVKSDIQSGRSKYVFRTEMSLWWTHIQSDVHESTITGWDYCDAEAQKTLDKGPSKMYMGSEAFSRYQTMIKESRRNKYKIPVDPFGHRVYTIDAKKWLTEAENNVQQFGQYGLSAFMKVHHRNCDNTLFRYWDQVAFNDQESQKAMITNQFNLFI